MVEGNDLENRAYGIIERQGSIVEAEDLTVRFDDYLQNLQRHIDSFDALTLEQDDFQDLQRELRRMRVRLNGVRGRLVEMIDANKRRYTTPIDRKGTPGRPRLTITRDQLEIFLQLGFTQVALARLLGK